MEKRIVDPTPPVTVDWEDWKLTITAGDTHWDETDVTGSPYCSVGHWDNGNFWDWLNSVVGEDTNIPVSRLLRRWILGSYADLMIESAVGLSLGMLMIDH